MEKSMEQNKKTQEKKKKSNKNLQCNSFGVFPIAAEEIISARERCSFLLNSVAVTSTLTNSRNINRVVTLKGRNDGA